MPVSLVKPSSTDCGTYSDQAKRFSSAADAGPTASSTLASAASRSDVKGFMAFSTPAGASGVPPPQSLGDDDGEHGDQDEHGRDRVERRIEALLDAAEDLERQRARAGA